MMESGLLIPLDKNKMKKVGWLNDAEQLCLRVTDKQAKANRLFVCNDDWFVLYSSGSPLSTEPLIMNWKTVAKDATESDILSAFQTTGEYYQITQVVVDNEESVFDDTVTHRYNGQQLYKTWATEVVDDWDSIQSYFNHFEFKQGQPLKKVSLYSTGTLYIQTSKVMDVPFIADLLTQTGYKSEETTLMEKELQMKRRVPHPLGQLDELVTFLSDNHSDLPSTLQAILTNGLYDELDRLKDENQSRIKHI